MTSLTRQPPGARLNFMADCKIPQDICRRGKESVNSRWNQCYSVFAGDFILATSSAILARTKNPEVGNKSAPEYSLHLSPKGDREYVSSSGRSCGGRVSADDHEVEKYLVDCFDLIHFEGETTRTDSIFIWRRVTTKLPALLRIPANLLLFYLQTAWTSLEKKTGFWWITNLVSIKMSYSTYYFNFIEGEGLWVREEYWDIFSAHRWFTGLHLNRRDAW